MGQIHEQKLNTLNRWLQKSPSAKSARPLFLYCFKPDKTKTGFLTGASSIVNPFKVSKWNSYKYDSLLPSLRKSLENDWSAIGQDYYKAMEAFASQHREMFPEQQQLFDAERFKEVS